MSKMKKNTWTKNYLYGTTCKMGKIRPRSKNSVVRQETSWKVPTG